MALNRFGVMLDCSRNAVMNVPQSAARNDTVVGGWCH